jgi:hypothetical protein
MNELRLKHLDVFDRGGAGGKLQWQHATACFFFSCLK